MGSERGWTSSERLAGAFFVCWLAVQLLLPVWQQRPGGSGRLGWQMYSSLNPAPVFVALGADGSRDTIPVRARLGFPRAEMRYDPIARQVCAQRPGTAAVELQTPGHPTRTIPCR